ncbi:hypothetical protein AGH21_29695 [Klebsiella oxytoca]|nr:hypothetical protein AGH21_29695 [Klebsiella oxytoca]
MLASQTRHDYCPQSSMIRGMLPRSIVMGVPTILTERLLRRVSQPCDFSPSPICQINVGASPLTNQLPIFRAL